MLICDNIGIIYNEKEIFKNFSGTFEDKSITYIRGKNGSGKTSLLKILSTIIYPTFGKLKLDDQDIDINNYRQIINYIGHNQSIKFNLSTFKNIEYWAKIYKNPELILASLYYFGLTKHIDKEVIKLSAGIRQRIELTRLMLKPSRIWLLDEPENNLDTEGKNLLRNLIVSKAEQGGIIIIASHNSLDFSIVSEISIDDYK